MNREEFLRQMGLSTDDVADPDTIIANIKEKNLTGSVQTAYFSRPRDKPYPGFASATGSIPSQPVSEEAKAKYDKYVNNRVENVVNGRVDDADTHYMPAQKEPYSGREDHRSSEGSKPSALDRERARQREAKGDEENEYDVSRTANRSKKDDFTEKEKEKEKVLSPLDRVTGVEQRRASYADKSDWISQGARESRVSPATTTGSRGMSKGLEVSEGEDVEISYGGESRKGSDPLKTKLNDNISVAKRIAEASRSFYSAGEDYDDGDKDDYPRKQQQQTKAATHDYESKTAFLRSLGIEDPTVGAPKTAGKGAAGGGGVGSTSNDIVSSTITASVAMTGADRTSALSNAVAARRAQRKAAAAAANGTGGGGGGGSLGRDDYQPPRSAPSAVDIVKEVASPYHGGGNTAKTPSPQTANSNHLSAVAAAAYADLKRASSEPSRDQQQYARGGGGGGGGLPSPSRAPAARVTITETVTYAKPPHDDGDSDDGYTAASFLNRRGNNSTNNNNNINNNRPPELNASRMAFGNLSSPLRSSNANPDSSSRLRESPTKIVNGLLFGEGSAKPNNNTSNHYNKGGLSSAYDSSSNPSSLNNTLSGSRSGGGGGVEYDPETANLSVEELKTLGNKSFENSDFRKAVRYYSKAIAKDPSNPALYSNRSAAYLQASKQMGMDTRSMSLRDAEKTIELSPKWFKGYSRKGDALYKMERYDDAIEAYEMGLEFDEGNPSLIHSIGEARNANGGISRRDKKDTPWAIEQRTTVNVKKTFGEGKSAHELVDLNRGELNDALGTLVLGDEYRKQQLERFRNSGKDGSSSSASARTSGNGKPSSTTTTSAATATNAREIRSTPPPAGGGKSLLDMIRSSSPEDGSIPLGAYPKSTAGGGGAEYGRRAGKEPLPESLTSDAASAYQQSLLDRYLARQQAGGGK